MRLSLLVLPLACFAGCMSDSERAAPAPAKPAAAAPAPVTPPPTAAVPAIVPAPVVVAPKPAPSPVSADLSKYTGPTENAALFGYDEGNSRVFLYSGGTISVPVKLAADGDYELVISAACDEANGQKAKFAVVVDDKVIAEEVTCTVVEPKEYVVKAPGLKAGEHKIGLTFLNDLYKENEYDLNFYVHGVTARAAK
jgi:hypothetical protein